jgi:hypothetical protein
MAVSTVKLNGATLMTVADTTATEDDVVEDKTFYKANGAKSAGISPQSHQYTETFTASDWTASGGGFAITVSVSTHGCGTDPAADVWRLSGTSYKKQYGYPSAGWEITVDALGNITLYSGETFAGKLRIST